MNVAIIGSGGREHAIALKIIESKNLSLLYCIPGNPGTELIASNISINPSDHNAIIEFCRSNKIDLVVIGPEQPLVDGLADRLRVEGITVFGPSSNAAQIESSKSFAKKIMNDAGVPTAQYKNFSSAQINEASEYLNGINYPTVIKADGLAAGKGVLICNNITEAELAIREIFEQKIFGTSGNEIIIEEFLEGEEASVFAITDGENFVCLPAAQDHKRIGDGDTGKNTGGMGAYAPAPIVSKALSDEIENTIIAPVIRQMRKTGNKFVGCLYAGLMITKSGLKVIEFNCRFGDPETQVVLPVLEGDFLGLLYSAASGNINLNAVRYSGGCSVCVVAASKGYPDEYDKGLIIEGLDYKDDQIIIYHAGTKMDLNNIVTNGGRVLGITSVLKTFDLQLAKKKAYDALNKISFDGMYFRKDISDKALKYIQ
ncbi:MAG TPA: phosphoribosylamine--glycine ligase [Ignavibacteriales bacterium]|nr:phosphoribosylamine--glycine ligase [Ignavibacteriales bacterium]